MKKEITLTNLKLGQEAEILFVASGWVANKRLADLGLTPGTEIKIIRKALFLGPIEIEVRGSRLVLGRGLAMKVIVKPI
jgi:Fe2+ transport system protein FeoA